MSPAPAVVVLDVNETLTDTGPLAAAFEAAGAPGALAPTWFAAVLRDGFALSWHGAAAPFAEVARATARSVLAAAGVPAERLEDAARAVAAAVGELPLRPDVAPGLRALRGAGLRVAALSQGAAATTEGLLEPVSGDVEAVLSVADAPGGLWKPAPSTYAWALERLGVEPGEAVLAAVHPWDVDGAARAGMRTAWVRRDAAVPYPAVLREPDVVVGGLDELAAAL